MERDEKGRFVKGSTGCFIGHLHSEEAKLKMRATQFKKNHKPWNKGISTGITYYTPFYKGMTPWNKGIPMTEESKQKWMLSMNGKRGRYINVSKIKKMKNILLKRKMSPSESKVNEFINQKKLPFIYTGNGLCWVIGNKNEFGNNEIFNPDFINLKKDKVIEVYSRWHITINSNIKRDKRREEVYQENGITPLIIFDEDLKKNPSEELNKIMEFIK